MRNRKEAEKIEKPSSSPHSQNCLHRHPRRMGSPEAQQWTLSKRRLRASSSLHLSQPGTGPTGTADAIAQHSQLITERVIQVSNGSCGGYTDPSYRPSDLRRVRAAWSGPFVVTPKSISYVPGSKSAMSRPDVSLLCITRD